MSLGIIFSIDKGYYISTYISEHSVKADMNGYDIVYHEILFIFVQD